MKCPAAECPAPVADRCTVPIDVFRIYLGCTWTDSAAVERLTRGLDAVPGLLYRFDRPAPDLPGSAVDPEEARALIRIAMTQSHVCLVFSEGVTRVREALAVELDLARHAFRRRIPVVLISGPDCLAESAVNADATVAWCPTSIATTLQQVAEAAAAERRAHYRNIAAIGRAGAQPEAPVPPGGGRRAAGPRESLPVAEIVQAYEELRARRGDAGRNQS